MQSPAISPSPKFRRRREVRALICALAGALMIYLLLATGLNLNLWEHSVYDSYTLQALAWRQGKFTLDEDYSWLELALYKDQVFVSFPPFPSVIMYVLTFFFGGDTPSMMVNLCLFLGSCAMTYCTARRFRIPPEPSAFVALFCVCGSNLLETSLSGGVWNVAQGCAFFFTSASLCAMLSPRSKRHRAAMVLGPLCIALAVGCRPFQAIYVPFMLYRLYLWCRRSGQKPFHTLLAMVPYVILPGLVAVAYGAYNYVRFDNIFEFGHNYLPEFSTQGGVQFSLAHWPGNLQNILRLPYFEENRLIFPIFFGFAFYLCNPLFVMALLELVRRIRRRKLTAGDAILLVSALIHFNLLLLHRTFGGWQFGTRYLIDLLPAIAVFTFREKRRFSTADALLMLWGICFNAYGAAVFHLAL